MVAHEIGHTLGLRHNFAGSLGASEKFKLRDRRSILGAYLKDGKTPDGIVPASSVMDYLIFEEDALTGNLVSQPGVVLDYDKKAIQTLYEKKHFAAKDVPVFCTDTHKSKFVDCQPFDTGHSSVEFAAWRTRQSIEDLPFQLVVQFEQAKKNVVNVDSLTALSQVSLSPATVADKMISARADLIKSFANDTRFLKIDRQFPIVGPLNLEDVQKAETEYFQNEVIRSGGVEKVFAAVTAEDLRTDGERFRRLLSVRSVANSKESYAFSSDEAAIVDGTIQRFFKKELGALVEKDVAQLSKFPSSWRDKESPLRDGFEKLAKQRVGEYVFAVIPGEETVAKIVVPVEGSATPMGKELELHLPHFAYPLESRTKGLVFLASLGDDWGSSWKDFSSKLRAELKTRFESILKRALADYPVEKIKSPEGVLPSNEKTAVVQWLEENKKIWDLLKDNSALDKLAPKKSETFNFFDYENWYHTTAAALIACSDGGTDL